MAGVYIHVPFCYKRCNYCDFHSNTNTSLLGKVIDSMVQEIELRLDYLNDKEIQTIYFGGGTPSILKKEELSKLFKALKNNYQIASNAEITMEMNPDDVKKNYIHDIVNLGFNRISLGIQSFDDDVLEYMNRRHNSKASFESCDIIRNAGIDNISIDLIYGIPNKSIDYWKNTVKNAMNLGVPHISAYCLSIEEGTRFDVWKKEAKLVEIVDEEMYEHYRYLCEAIKLNGYEHYEVSNFSLPDMHSRHNQAYWNNVEYIGIGPSAHSYNVKGRQWNVASNAKYVDCIDNGMLYFENEILHSDNKYDEYIMTRLRTSRGIDLLEMEAYLGINYKNYFYKKINNPKFEKYIEKNGTNVRFNETGFWFMDGVISELAYTL